MRLKIIIIIKYMVCSLSAKIFYIYILLFK